MFQSQYGYNIISDNIPLQAYYSIYRDGTIYYTLSYGSPNIYPDSLQEFYFTKKLSRSELKNLKSDLTILSTSQWSTADFSELDHVHTYSVFKINGREYFSNGWLHKKVECSLMIKNLFIFLF